MSTAVRRAPELRPRLLGGRALPAARRMRLSATPDGAVVLTDPEGGTTTLARPGEVRRVALVDLGTRRFTPGDAFTGMVLALLDGEGVPLCSVRLLDWWPNTYSSKDEALDVTGARALAAALGLPIEPVEEAELSSAALRRALVRPYPPRPWPGMAASWLGWLGFGCALVVIGAGGTWVAAAGTALALFLAGPVQVSGSRARADAREAAATQTPTPAGTTVLQPAPDRPTPRGLVEATLRIGSADVVVTDRGRELWLPGPAGGGVSRALVEPTLVRLTDTSGREYARLETALWAPTPERREHLAQQLRQAGLDTVLSPVATTGADPAGSVAAALTGGIPPSDQLGDTERGDATKLGPWVAGAAIALASCTAVFGTLSWNPVVGGVLAVVALGLLAMRLTDAWRMRRSNRRAMRPVEVPVPAVVR